jgi:hypothetical protein
VLFGLALYEKGAEKCDARKKASGIKNKVFRLKCNTLEE